MISIVDYGLGNIGSVVNMLRYLNINCQVASSIQELENAEKLILPGVGAFDAGMNKIKDKGFFDILNFLTLEKKVPTLGICMGFQLMCKSSWEGKLAGFGWFENEVKKFPGDINIKVPHMGWNDVNVNKTHSLNSYFDRPQRYYFVHSYFVERKNSFTSLATCIHGVEFEAILQFENLMGVQFHPEKSHRFGMNVFRLFEKI